MAFERKLPEWHEPGVEPSETQKKTGFQPGMKPPAQWFNWFMNWMYLALKEFQEKAVEKSYVDSVADELRVEIGNADIPDASLTVKGKVQLSNETNGIRENFAPTEKALGLVMKEAQAGKQAGIDRKVEVVAALNSIGVSASTNESWEQLIPKMAAIIRATGNATAADLLAGKTASNASGPITGNIPARGAGGTVTPGTANQTKDAGYYSSAITILGDPDLLAGNIRSGVNIFGVNGSLMEGKKFYYMERTSTGDMSVNVGFNWGLVLSMSTNYQWYQTVVYDPVRGTYITSGNNSAAPTFLSPTNTGFVSRLNSLDGGVGRIYVWERG
ncbi:tail fiber protein [Paenibacillus sp. EC2-1]|uniref:tail fiber protein n=1 Tax=Paenibacillus sp. EC2-1 TaxID=3388665 RepID=UPI003BEF318D